MASTKFQGGFSSRVPSVFVVVATVCFCILVATAFANQAQAEVRIWNIPVHDSVADLSVFEPAPGNPPTSNMPQVIFTAPTLLKTLGLNSVVTPLASLSGGLGNAKVASFGSLIAVGDSDTLMVTHLGGVLQTIATLPAPFKFYGGIQALAFNSHGDLFVGSDGTASVPSVTNVVVRFDSLAPGGHSTVVAGGGDRPVTHEFQPGRSVVLDPVVGIDASNPNAEFIATSSDVLELRRDGEIAIQEKMPDGDRLVAMAAAPDHTRILLILHRSPDQGFSYQVVRDSGNANQHHLVILARFKDVTAYSSVAVAQDGTIFVGLGRDIKVISDTTTLPHLDIQARRARLDLSAALSGTRSPFPQINIPLVNADWSRVRELLSAIIPHAAAFTKTLEEQFVPTKLKLFRESLGRPSISS